MSQVFLMTANYSRVVATVGLRRLTGHYSSLLFTPLLLVTCLALVTPWLLAQVLAPLLLTLLSLLVLGFKIWFRSTQVDLCVNTRYMCTILICVYPGAPGAGEQPGHGLC